MFDDSALCKVFMCAKVVVCCRRVSQVSSGWAESCLEETVCSVNATTTPRSVTVTVFVW